MNLTNTLIGFIKDNLLIGLLKKNMKSGWKKNKAYLKEITRIFIKTIMMMSIVN